MLQFGIAKELGMSLAHVRQMTLEEIDWLECLFSNINEDQEKEIKKCVNAGTYK